MAQMPPLDPSRALFIRDVAHDYVRLSASEARLVGSPLLQRLRHISQNAFAYLTFPAMRVDRFSHSVGVCHVSGLLIESALANSRTGKSDADENVVAFLKSFSEEVAQVLYAEIKAGAPYLHEQVREAVASGETLIVAATRLAGLVHDLGHLPYSHAGEEGIEPFLQQILNADDYIQFARSGKRYHEYCGLHLMRSMDAAYVDPLLARVALLILDVPEPSTTYPALSALHRLVDSDIDADKCDYILRDGTLAGHDYGRYDLERLVSSMRIIRQDGGFYVLPTEDAIHAVERLLFERYFLHKWIYYHRFVKLCDTAVSRVVGMLLSHQLREKLGDKLPKEFENFEEAFHFTRVGLIDDVWLMEGMRKLYFGLLASPLGPVRDQELEILARLLGLLVQREKTAWAVWKRNLDFYEFCETFHSDLCVPTSDPWPGTDVRNLSADDKKTLVNYLTLLDPYALALVEAELTRSLAELAGPVQVVICVLPRFRVFKKSVRESANAMLHRRVDRWEATPITQASPFIASLEQSRKWDLKVYMYVVHEPAAVDPPEDLEAQRCLIRQNLAKKLADICRSDPFHRIALEAIVR
jgi:HD superfamily phosphohydrolase